MPKTDAEGDCPSCGGLNTACPDGCGRDPLTGELNGTRPATAPTEGGPDYEALWWEAHTVAEEGGEWIEGIWQLDHQAAATVLRQAIDPLLTAKDAEIARLREVLEPFACDDLEHPVADENGWTDFGVSWSRDRIVDWFGPSAFRKAAACLRAKAHTQEDAQP